ncbi:MAG: hypothetical protein EZS28_002312 [Streblomastix strix]|uniref:Uncharacterized protein n=1 Tax=Streblomastix strix TaxID=222440 RepID=A0A5J4X594_9EUKA|nr:MAG: hypothetical protein EZS28_002312 [Streblomastix strix]
MQHSDQISGYMAMGEAVLNILVLALQQEVRLLVLWFKLARLSGTVVTTQETAATAVNFNEKDDITDEQDVPIVQGEQLYIPTDLLRFWLGFSTAYGSLQSIMPVSNIKATLLTFAMPQYPIWFFLDLFHNFNLVIDQQHVIPAPYEALILVANGQMFNCFVDQDVVVRVMFDDNPDPQVLSLEVIDEMG